MLAHNGRRRVRWVVPSHRANAPNAAYPSAERGCAVHAPSLRCRYGGGARTATPFFFQHRKAEGVYTVMDISLTSLYTARRTTRR